MGKILIYCFLVAIVIVVGCTSKDTITGRTIAVEKTVDDVLKEIDGQAEVQKVEHQSETEEKVNEQQIKTGDESTKPQVEARVNETEEDNNKENNNTSIVEEQPKKTEEFKFSPESIVNTQNNVSISIDNIKHEIKSEYWGKIIEITTTIQNYGNTSFKPKVLVLLYDEKDFKEEWLRPKAEIGFDIGQLNSGEHITRQAIVNIAFDNINLTKNFKLVLVDAADLGNKPLVVVEKEFIAQYPTY